MPSCWYRHQRSLSPRRLSRNVYQRRVQRTLGERVEATWHCRGAL